MADRDAMSDEGWLKPPPSALGLHVVYPGPEAEDTDDATIESVLDVPTKPHETDRDDSVVAVHGLGGDSYSTFTKDDCLWIRDLLPSSPYFKNARIMTFGYNAQAFLHPFAQETKGRTFIFAEKLLTTLRAKRRSPKTKGRPIIFLGHSLGGIVIKSALRHAHERPPLFGDILDSAKAIVFFGTPHQGADVATWGAFLGSLGKAIRIHSTEVVEELKRWSNPLIELTVAFSHLAQKIQITTFFETKPTHGVMVVHEASARMGHPLEVYTALEADHRGVCKFTEDDSNWNTVLPELESIADEILKGLELPKVPVGPISRKDKDREDDDFQERFKRLRE